MITYVADVDEYGPKAFADHDTAVAWCDGHSARIIPAHWVDPAIRRFHERRLAGLIGRCTHKGDAADDYGRCQDCGEMIR